MRMRQECGLEASEAQDKVAPVFSHGLSRDTGVKACKWWQI